MACLLRAYKTPFLLKAQSKRTLLSTQKSMRAMRHHYTGGGGGAKKIRGITVFSYSSPLGGVRPEKKIPPLCVKKFRNPNFFLKNTTSCFFILCKRSLHNALRTPNISYFAGTNLDPYISLWAQISATTKRGC